MATAAGPLPRAIRILETKHAMRGTGFLTFQKDAIEREFDRIYAAIDGQIPHEVIEE